MRPAIPHTLTLIAACGVLAGASCAPQRNASNVIGATVPKVSLESYDTPGEFKTLESFKGKALVISFFKTTSDPSREAMPFLDSVYSTYREKGLEVVAVTSEPRDVVDTFRLDTHYDAPIYLDKDGTLFKAMKIYAIPAFVVVSADGVVQVESHPIEKNLLLEAIETAVAAVPR